jgi:uncharacterized damage-inducible protein DinB
MNRFMRDNYAMFVETHGVRDLSLKALTDADLSFRLGGNTQTVAALCLDIGKVQRAYIESLKTFKLDFAAAQAPGGVEAHIDSLATWYADLDAQMKTALEQLTDADLDRPVDRGGWSMPTQINLMVYREALLIFAAKVSVYLRALGRPLPKMIEEWIA